MTLAQKNNKDSFTGRLTPFRLVLLSLVSAVFFIYPNIAFFSMEREYLGEAKHTVHILFFIFRYIYFSAIIWILVSLNLKWIRTPLLSRRIVRTLLVTIVLYLIYIGFSLLLSPKQEWFTGLLLFQFFVIFLFAMLTGHLSYLDLEQRRKEHEIEQLRIENLESRYNALTNQINPHFFFNSLNGLTALIRKKNDETTLEYVNKLSDVFRYILERQESNGYT